MPRNRTARASEPPADVSKESDQVAVDAAGESEASDASKESMGGESPAPEVESDAKPAKPAKASKSKPAAPVADEDEGPSRGPKLSEYEAMAVLSTGSGKGDVQPGAKLMLDDEQAMHWLRLGAVKRCL